jgi:hypothetical protein
MKPKNADDEYSKQETQQRFEAALRGARVAGQKRAKPATTKRSVKRKRPQSSKSSRG